MPQNDLDRVRAGVLDRMEKADRVQRIGIIAAALLEAAIIAFALIALNWKDRMQVLLFLFSTAGYTIVVLGLVALGAHVSRSVGRVLAALESRT